VEKELFTMSERERTLYAQAYRTTDKPGESSGTSRGSYASSAWTGLHPMSPNVESHQPGFQQPSLPKVKDMTKSVLWDLISPYIPKLPKTGSMMFGPKTNASKTSE
jgi:hypothetical protein